MPVVFMSKANYQPITNAWTEHFVTLSLDDSGRFTATSDEDKTVVLDVPLSRIERVYDYYSSLVITVDKKQYRFNFSKPINFGKSLLFWGYYNWVAPFINNPLKGVKNQWLHVFEQFGIKPYRDKLGRSILIGILVPIVLIALFILGVYIFIIQK